MDVTTSGLAERVSPAALLGYLNFSDGRPDLTTAYITASGKGTLYAHEWHCPGLALNFGGFT